MRKIFTSESVTEGHPDKVCDYIADSLLDAILEQDSNSRSAIECCANGNTVIVMGEVTTNAKINVEEIVRSTIREIGYTKEEYGFNAETCKIIVDLKEQSRDIALGVDNSKETKEGENLGHGAGDQGMVFGFASDENEEFMPMPLFLANKLSKRLTEIRKQGILPYLRPDGKTEVALEYEGDKVVRVHTIVISAQHDENISHEKIEEDILKNVVKAVIPNELLDKYTKYYINPTGRFVIGGPAGDSGLTGRKIIVDTYGGMARHGGGSFSGKDYTKVDRSAAYMARYIAKNIVSNKIAKKCEIQIAYAIGVAKPVSVCVDTFGTSKISDNDILNIINKNFDLTPDGIIKTLDLKKPIYKFTTNYGHFGKQYLAWEKTMKLDTNI